MPLAGVGGPVHAGRGGDRGWGSIHPPSFVILAQAGIQKRYAGDPAATSPCLNSRLRGDDGGERGGGDVPLPGGGAGKVSKFTQVAPIAAPFARRCGTVDDGKERGS